VVHPGAETGAFAIDSRPIGPGQLRIAVRGELDLSHAAELKGTLERELVDGRTVLLDLSAVGFIDSTGLAAIVTALNHCRDSDSELQLCSNLQPQARRLMELTGVLSLMSVVDGDPPDGSSPIG
jgi:anti-anti-sigma factor